MSPRPQHERLNSVDRERAQRAARRQDRLYRAQRRRRCDRVHDPRPRPASRLRARPCARSIPTSPSRSPPTASARCASARSRPRRAAGRRSTSRSRSSAAASTRPAPRSRRSSARARTASSSSCPGVDNPEHVKALLGRTAKLTFQLVDTSVNLEEARRGRLPPGDEILPARGGRGGAAAAAAYVVRKRVMVGGDTLVDAQADVPEQRAGRQLQVRRRRRHAASAMRRARMSASRSRSSSTTR